MKDVGDELQAHLAATAVRYREYAGWFEEEGGRQAQSGS